MREFLEIAYVISIFGIKGEVRVQYSCNSADVLCAMKNLYSKDGKIVYKIKRAFPHKNTVILGIDGINTVDEAKLLLRKKLYARRKDFNLKHGEFFIEDLIGLDVIDVDTENCYGKISEVLQSYSNDVYVVKDNNGSEILFPAIKPVVIDIDLKKGFMKVRPIEGLLEVYADDKKKAED
ncbi:MAG: 16S rRNA processing protein RimM [Clostridiales bacterium]|nr:16S rRNA processing protein RimM [Clostridiales bacterium]